MTHKFEIGNKVIKSVKHNSVGHYGIVEEVKEDKVRVRWYANQAGWENVNQRTWVKPEIIKLQDEK